MVLNALQFETHGLNHAKPVNGMDHTVPTEREDRSTVFINHLTIAVQPFVLHSILDLSLMNLVIEFIRAQKLTENRHTVILSVLRNMCTELQMLISSLLKSLVQNEDPSLLPHLLCIYLL